MYKAIHYEEKIDEIVCKEQIVADKRKWTKLTKIF